MNQRTQITGQRSAAFAKATARQADLRSQITDNRASARRAFTLVELTIVLGIIVALSILAIPAISSRKSANDMTKVATALKSVLDQARAYAQANNTYTWVGFYEEDASQSSTNPPTKGTGRLV